MKEQAEELLGVPVQAGSFILGKGSSVRKGIAAGASSIGLQFKPTIKAVDFGQVGYLALTADEVVIFSGKQGLIRPKIIGLVTRRPRRDLSSFQLEQGKMLVSGSIVFSDGAEWTFEVPRARAKQMATVEEELQRTLA